MTSWEVIFDISGRAERVKTLESRMAKSDFWHDSGKARRMMREASLHKGLLERWRKIKQAIDDIEVLMDLYEESHESDVEAEFKKSVRSVERDLEKLEIESLMKGEDDEKDAILTIHPGAGGTESQDWAEMLLRMYTRWAERKGFKVNLMDKLAGEEAGIKSATLEISGRYAYGYLKAESGVHRLVRISPFDASHRRHTSFASVFVYAEADEDLEIEIKESDLRIDTFRASGAGGQHVNKTDSAVRITHLPTKIVVQCQSERSQHRNRENAMKILKAKLHAYYLEQQRKKREEIEKSKMEIAWGSQIRSYVLQPYRLVKDHRTGLDTSDVDSVLDGNIDEFIEAYLRLESKQKRGLGDEANN